MTYTVSQLAKISGTTVRALRWYDIKGILKPAYYGANKYRYYKETQLQQLQQILFFKNLGYNLNDIRKLLTQDNIHKIKTLKSRKKVLVKDIADKKSLIDTIDKTISYLTRSSQFNKIKT
ncbi:MAG: MerR family transcriptional regulator [Rickettsiales bacterium]|nr:MerR family transcriptional regulator [Rickettsiales bacterium]